MGSGLVAVAAAVGARGGAGPREQEYRPLISPSMASWGADVQPYGTPLVAAPAYDQPHDRNAWVHYAMGDYPAVELSIADEQVIPYYSWLAKTFSFFDDRFGAGTNSTPGHLLTFSGQTPTFRNPPSTGAHPVSDIPTVFTLAGRAGRSWGAFTDQDGYPVNLVKGLRARRRHWPVTSTVRADWLLRPMRARCLTCAMCGVGPDSTSIPPRIRVQPTTSRKGTTWSGRRSTRSSPQEGGRTRSLSSPGTTGAATPITSRHRISKLCPTHSILAGFRPSGALGSLS